MTFATDAKKLKAINDHAINTAGTMRNAVQAAAIANLLHAGKHGDYNGVNYLIEGLGLGVKRDSLIAFFIKVGGFIVDVNPALGFTGWSGKEFIRDNLKLAKEKPWYEYKKDAKPFEGYNFEEELRKFVNKASKLQHKVASITDEEEKSLYSFTVSDDLMRQVLALANFNLIIDSSPVANDLDSELIEELKKVC